MVDIKKYVYYNIENKCVLMYWKGGRASEGGINIDMENNPIIRQMADDIIKICSPFQIFLVSSKSDKMGDLTSFKLCIIVADSYTPSVLETDILVNTDCPVPCDILVYNITEWNDIVQDDCSFAYKVDNAGVLIYEQG